MEVERLNAQTAVLHMAQTVSDDDSPALKRLLQALYDDEVQTIHVDFTETELIRKPCLGLLVMYQTRLTARGGELKFVNVTGDYVKHLFDMLDLRRVICIEEVG